jgi:hypothetical protein
MEKLKIVLYAQHHKLAAQRVPEEEYEDMNEAEKIPPNPDFLVYEGLPPELLRKAASMMETCVSDGSGRGTFMWQVAKEIVNQVNIYA